MQSRKSREDPEINLIPLIDVSLLLVIFFMLSSTFLQEGRLKIELPQASLAPTGKQKTDPLVVAVTQSGTYRVNDRELINSSPDTLRAAILEVAGADRSKSVTVRADARSTHQSVVTAMDVLGKLGFVRINIATVEDTPAQK
jgi:biopolymer transport protein ExbD